MIANPVPGGNRPVAPQRASALGAQLRDMSGHRRSGPQRAARSWRRRRRRHAGGLRPARGNGLDGRHPLSAGHTLVVVFPGLAPGVGDDRLPKTGGGDQPMKSRRPLAFTLADEQARHAVLDAVTVDRGVRVDPRDAARGVLTELVVALAPVKAIIG